MSDDTTLKTAFLSSLDNPKTKRLRYITDHIKPDIAELNTLLSEGPLYRSVHINESHNSPQEWYVSLTGKDDSPHHANFILLSLVPRLDAKEPFFDIRLRQKSDEYPNQEVFEPENTHQLLTIVANVIRGKLSLTEQLKLHQESYTNFPQQSQG